MRTPSSIAVLACCTAALLLGCAPRDGADAPAGVELVATTTAVGEEGIVVQDTRAVVVETSDGTVPMQDVPQQGSMSPTLIVHKTPTCGCCLAWADQMRAAGFEVELRDTNDLNPIKQALGVPASSASCHTAEVGGYFVEGHVPAADIRRLLAERPDARGIAVPGMPLGSPGMEVPSGETQAYQVLLIGEDGQHSVFAEHGD